MASALIAKTLLKLLLKHGISNGANLSKNLGFKSKDILKASKQVIKNIKKLPKKDTVTIYRGYPEWFQGRMVKNGNFVGGGGSAIGARQGGMFSKSPQYGSLYTSTSKQFAKKYASKLKDEALGQYKFLKSKGLAPKKQASLLDIVRKGSGPVLEFRVPKEFLSTYGLKSRRMIQLVSDKNIAGSTYAFPEGLPKEFLKKVL